MFERLLAQLRTQYANKGLSEATLRKIATNLAKTVTEEAQVAEAVNGVEEMLTIMQSEADARATAAAAKAKAEKPTEEPAKQDPPAPTPAPAPGKEKPEEVPAWAQTIIDQNKLYNERILAIEQGKSTETRQQKLADVLKDAPKSFKTVIEKAFPNMKFDKEEDFDAYIEGLKTDVGTAKQEEADSAVRGTPRPGQAAGPVDNKPATKEEIDNVMKGLKF